MKSLERIFNQIKQDNPACSDYTCLAKAVQGRNFSERTIRKHFNKLVSKSEFNSKDKKDLLRHLTSLSRTAEKDAEDS